VLQCVSFCCSIAFIAPSVALGVLSCSEVKCVEESDAGAIALGLQLLVLYLSVFKF